MGGAKSKNFTGLFWFLVRQGKITKQPSRDNGFPKRKKTKKHVILVGQAIGAGLLADTFSLVTRTLTFDLWEVSGTKHARF